MRIAQIAPLFESIPPQLYGGTERVVSVLTEELVSRGHDVTLFASGDSVTSATLAPCSKRSLRLEGTTDHVALTTIEVARVFDRQGEFDMIHNHVDYFAFPFARQRRTPMITTTHGRLDLDEIRNVYDYFAEAPGPGDRDSSCARDAAQDRGQSRCDRQGLFRTRRQATPLASPNRVRRRGRGSRQGRVPWQRLRLPLSDRLAGTFRPHNGGGDGLWYAGGRDELWLVPGGRRERRLRLHLPVAPGDDRLGSRGAAPRSGRLPRIR